MKISSSFALGDDTNFIGFNDRIEVNDRKAGTIKKVGDSVLDLVSTETQSHADRDGDGDGEEGDFHRIKRN